MTRGFLRGVTPRRLVAPRYRGKVNIQASYNPTIPAMIVRDSRYGRHSGVQIMEILDYLGAPICVFGGPSRGTASLPAVSCFGDYFGSFDSGGAGGTYTAFNGKVNPSSIVSNTNPAGPGEGGPSLYLALGPPTSSYPVSGVKGDGWWNLTGNPHYMYLCTVTGTPGTWVNQV